ncbi:S41 family peptidase [uncultured Tenacibaculum sp.]|uniref:S41 family peptidase n=1 Tax=uncultured Tenacibaculum sp. TaxID=174713 RepID=UPI00260D0553|nr:S41 family peptidase [uncultured Tenacibaculum sp.]
MKFIKPTLLCILTFIAISCSRTEFAPDNIQVQSFVWRGLNAYYLSQNQIPDLSDRRFNNDQQLYNYLSGFNDPNALFQSLLIGTDTKSLLQADYNTLTTPQVRTGNTNGVEFGIIADPSSADNVVGYITHILPNSDASGKNLVRGEFFYAVDNTQLTRGNFESLLVNGSNNFTLNMANFNGTSVTPNGKSVALVKSNYNYTATFKDNVINSGLDVIGYLMYNNDFSSNYLSGLNQTFANLQSQSVNKLILDLRYQVGSGAIVKNLEKIASMITNQPTTEVLVKEKWNSKAQPWFESNQPDSLLTKFSDKLNATTNLNRLAITDLYIILNGQNFTGSSATELLINSLRPHINVHILGRTTSGNNTGSITLYDSEDYNLNTTINRNHTFALQPIVLNFLNKNDETYENGFNPTLTLCTNEDPLNLGVLGENSDPIIARILNFISSGVTGNPPSCNPMSFEHLYNSIDLQRERDTGVFIEQVLPKN